MPGGCLKRSPAQPGPAQPCLTNLTTTGFYRLFWEPYLFFHTDFFFKCPLYLNDASQFVSLKRVLWRSLRQIKHSKVFFLWSWVLWENEAASEWHFYVQVGIIIIVKNVHCFSSGPGLYPKWARHSWGVRAAPGLRGGDVTRWEVRGKNGDIPSLCRRTMSVTLA